MGWRPHEVRASTVPELLAAFDGFLEFHGASTGPEPLLRSELEDLMAQYPD